jgi:hypothetical protein
MTRQIGSSSCASSPRSRRSAIGVGRTETFFDKAPVDAPRGFRRRVREVDDLIEPLSQEVVPLAVAPLRWPHRRFRQNSCRQGQLFFHRVAHDEAIMMRAMRLP